MDVTLTASTLSGSTPYTLYVEVTGVHVSWYGGAPQIFSPAARVASDGSGEYSIGQSYTLKSDRYYNWLSFSAEVAGCGCLHASGPYVAVKPLALDPRLLPTSPQPTPGAVPITSAVNMAGQPVPGRPPGKYYTTSLSSIADDKVDLDGAGVRQNQSVVIANPQAPENPYTNTWQWRNITVASATLLDLAKQNSLDGSLFYAGIFLGIAGAGVLALVPEVSRVVEIWSGKKRSRRRAKAAAEAKAGHPGQSDETGLPDELASGPLRPVGLGWPGAPRHG